MTLIRQLQDLAVATRADVQQSLGEPIVTEIVPAAEFDPAEEYHQRYFEEPGRASCAVTLRQRRLSGTRGWGARAG